MRIAVGSHRWAAALALAAPTLAATQGQPSIPRAEWRDWGGDAAQPGHFSPLNQINAANVSRLKPAWVWDGGTFGRSWEITPLLVDGLLYVSESGSSDADPGAGAGNRQGSLAAQGALPFPGRGVDRRGLLAYGAGDGTMKPRIVVLWKAILMFGLDLKTGELSSDWPAAGLDIGLPNPANGRAIGGGVFAASPTHHLQGT